MNADWRTELLGNVLTFQRGYDITRDVQEDGPYPVISSSGPKSTHSKFMARGPGVVIGRKGSLGTVFYAESDYWPHDTTLWVKDFHGNDPRFAYYFLQSMHFERLDVGASNPTLNRNHIHAIPVLWPNPRLQKEIAERLSAYDGLIENCERRIRVLDEMAREVYREWFMNFRYPGHEKVPLVDSTIGRIPKEWAFKPIGEVYDGLFDGPHLTPPPASEGAVFLGIGNLSEDGRLDLSSCRYIGEDDLARWTKRVTPQPGDIVFTYEASLHRYAIIPNGFYGCLGRRLALVRTKAERKIGRYLFMSMLSDRWRDVVTRNVLSGSTVDRVPLTRFPEFQILIATTEIIERFDDIVEPLMRDQEVINRAAINLRNTRDLLLPRLLSGQLSVSDVAA